MAMNVKAQLQMILGTKESEDERGADFKRQRSSNKDKKGVRERGREEERDRERDSLRVCIHVSCTCTWFHSFSPLVVVFWTSSLPLTETRMLFQWRSRKGHITAATMKESPLITLTTAPSSSGGAVTSSLTAAVRESTGGSASNSPHVSKKSVRQL